MINVSSLNSCRSQPMSVPAHSKRVLVLKRALLLGIVCVALSSSRRSVADEAQPVTRDDSAAATVKDIDSIFERNWRQTGITPAELSDDSMFLRRVTLDLTGRIPSANDVRTFLKDQRSDKRLQVIERLLQNPRHSRHLAGLWRDVLLPRDTPVFLAETFESWLRLRFQQQTAYDELTREILTSRGTVSQSEAVVFFTAHSIKPEELAASTSRVFLGVEVRCAQCHDHPSTKWKQDAFWGFAAFFGRMEPLSGAVPNARIEDQPDGEVFLPGSGAVASPRFLDGTTFSEATAEPRRAVLARWITSADNPFFSRAIANRVWWILLGRGIADPVDDLGPHNPGTHPEILDRLAADFNSHGFDLRRLFRIIMATRAYHLSSLPVKEQEGAEANYACMPIRSLSARQVYDSLLQAAGNRDTLESMSPQVQAGRQEFLKKFDVPVRQATEFQGGIPQSLSLLNGPFVSRMTSPVTGDLISALIESPFQTDEQRVETLFLSTVSRLPTSDERARTARLMSARSTNRAQVLGDILWALLNSSEFVMNR